jgi:hypothetical protein
MNRAAFSYSRCRTRDLGIASRAGDAGSNDRGQRDKRENDRKNLFHDADLDGNLPAEMHVVPKGCRRIKPPSQRDDGNPRLAVARIQKQGCPTRMMCDSPAQPSAAALSHPENSARPAHAEHRRRRDLCDLSNARDWNGSWPQPFREGPLGEKRNDPF